MEQRSFNSQLFNDERENWEQNIIFFWWTVSEQAGRGTHGSWSWKYRWKTTGDGKAEEGVRERSSAFLSWKLKWRLKFSLNSMVESNCSCCVHSVFPWEMYTCTENSGRPLRSPTWVRSKKAGIVYYIT